MSRKPSPAVNLVILLLILVPVAAVGYGAFYAYKKWVAPSAHGELPPIEETPSLPPPVSPPISDSQDEMSDPSPEASEKIPSDTPPEVADASEAAVLPDEAAATTDDPPPIDPTEDSAATEMTDEPIVTETEADSSTPDLAGAETPPAGGDPGTVPSEGSAEIAAAADDAESTIPDELVPDPTEILEGVYDTAAPEAMQFREDALKRVDEAPYDADRKRLARRGLQEARQVAKVCTVYFEKAGDALDQAEIQKLATALGDEQYRAIINDRDSIVFILGFADPTGPRETNIRLSRTRAEHVKDILKSKIGIALPTEPVGVGPTTLVDTQNQERNRAAEVWLVLR